MNQQEWKTSGRFRGKYKWYNKTRELQKSLCYESDTNANIIHHLRDTEEQRKYNDTHYEYWGFNEDGTYEYGKYVVFWTKERHDAYHKESDETRLKKSNAAKEHWANDDYRNKISNSLIGHVVSDETRAKLSAEMHGKRHSDETRMKMSAAHKTGKCATEEYRLKISKASTNLWKDDKYREKVLDKLKKAMSTSEYRKKTK
jgi:hypothetical protein